MPWFKIDDGFHCHPKVFAAGTAAVGLYVRCGSWAAQQTSEGVIPRAVAKMYGTPRMIKALLEAGLWHDEAHECKLCPPVAKGGFLIHQYLDYNPSREAVETARAAKTERQRRWRQKHRSDDAEGDPEQSQHESDANPNQSWKQNDDDSERNSAPDSRQNNTGSSASSQVNGFYGADVDASTQASRARHGDAAPNPARPNPSSSPTEKKKEETASYASPPTRIGDRPRIPAASQPLVDALHAAGLITGWDLQDTEWFLIEALIRRCGIPALVVSARGSWQGANKQPRSGRYFLPAWRALPDAPTQMEQQQYLPAAVGDNVHHFPNPGHRPSTTDARVQQAIDTGARLQALADAARAQEQS